MAAIFGYLAGNINSYIFGKNWVFKSSINTNFYIVIKYLMVYLFGGLLMSSTKNFLSINGIDHRLAWGIGLFFTTLNNFYGSKYIVFKNN